MLLGSAHLEPSVTSDPERPLPLGIVADLLEKAARQSGCDHFGLLMAESRSLASIGPVSLLLRHEPQAGDVIDALVRYQNLFGGAIRVEPDLFDEALIVRFELEGARQPRQATELVVACFCRIVAAAIGGPWRPESVHFTHKPPRDLRSHQRLFSCPIDFGAGFNGIVCTHEDLEQRNPAGDPGLVAHAERLLELLMPAAAHLTGAEQVRRSLRLLLPEQRGTIEQVARNMCMTPRSLQRLLDREGCTFGGLLNEVRRELAQTYLADQHQIGMVANMTGYRRPSSFSRWFFAEFGMSPAEWRRSAGQKSPSRSPRKSGARQLELGLPGG